ncbi:GDP-L-fucose synthase [Marinilabiliaceae bacterium ANBcel2]|nr:GDP-L-fucose synthase [Marinilabiliaceae bacterium ANBcel2]
MRQESSIYVAGHNGLVGSAITRKLREKGYHNLILPSREKLNLLDQASVNSFFEKEKPQYVFLAAAKVGGIMANNRYRAQFIYENLQIQNNIINSSWKHNVEKLLFLGSSCIYPRDASQPMKEEYLLNSPLEYTNEPYAIAKIAGIKMCESYNLQYNTNFISVMPTNLYGENDNYDLNNSHVLPALIRKMHLGKLLKLKKFDKVREDLKRRPFDGLHYSMSDSDIIESVKEFGIFCDGTLSEIQLWGTGEPRREFLYSDDLADALYFVMQNIDFEDIVKSRDDDQIRNTHLNIGCGEDLSIYELALLIKKVVGYDGAIKWDSSKPDGTYRKLMDVSRLNSLGWKASTSLEEGVRRVYNSYIAFKNI